MTFRLVYIVVVICVNFVIAQDTIEETVDHVLKGNSFYQQKKYNQAIEEYKKAIEKQQQTAFAWHNLSLCYI